MQVPSAAQRWKLSTSPSSKQAALNWPEVSEKSARTNSPPRRVRPLLTPSTIAAMTAGIRPPPGTPASISEAKVRAPLALATARNCSTGCAAK